MKWADTSEATRVTKTPRNDRQRMRRLIGLLVVRLTLQ